MWEKVSDEKLIALGFVVEIHQADFYSRQYFDKYGSLASQSGIDGIYTEGTLKLPIQVLTQNTLPLTLLFNDVANKAISIIEINRYVQEAVYRHTGLDLYGNLEFMQRLDDQTRS